jgi:hypothetical protein
MITELNPQTARGLFPGCTHPLDVDALLAWTGSSSLSVLWHRLANRVYALPIRSVSMPDYERACPGDGARILRHAETALARDLLGDVAMPREWSRLHWLMAAGQAYLLTGDDRYAAGVRGALETWMAANPIGYGVNWYCSAEASLRTLSWTLFFHVFARSHAWSEPEFQSRFLRMLYLHGKFIEGRRRPAAASRYHVTADAVGLVFAGLFFGKGDGPVRWSDEGWRLLCDEGSHDVDSELLPSAHRLGLELMFLAARYREACGLQVADAYRDCVVGLARFTLPSTSQADSTPPAPDPARALPFGCHATDDHQYLAGLIGAHWSVPELIDRFSGVRPEIFWMLGPRAASLLRESTLPKPRHALFGVSTLACVSSAPSVSSS